MSTHNIPSAILKRKSPEIILIMSAAMGVFVRDLRTRSK